MRGSCRGGSWSSASWEEMARAYRRGEERKDTERRLGVGGIARTRGAVSCSLACGICAHAERYSEDKGIDCRRRRHLGRPLLV